MRVLTTRFERIFREGGSGQANHMANLPKWLNSLVQDDYSPVRVTLEELQLGVKVTLTVTVEVDDEAK
jgi:hypothetical protein